MRLARLQQQEAVRCLSAGNLVPREVQQKIFELNCSNAECFDSDKRGSPSLSLLAKTTLPRAF